MTTTKETEQSATELLKEFHNELVHFSIAPKPNCILEITATAKKPLIEKLKQESIRPLTKQISAPGFRKGKAPESYILKHYPHEIENKAKNALPGAVLNECLNLASIPLLKQGDKEPEIRYTIQNFNDEEAKISIFLEIDPTTPSIDPAQCSVTKTTAAEPTEEQVSEGVRQTLFFFAEWAPISDRPVQEGDFLILDADVIETATPTPLFRGTRFEVSDKSMSSWMKNSLIGKSLHETIEGVSMPDEKLSQEEKALFPSQKVRMTIKAIESATLPELTTELLSKIGIESEEALKKNIKERFIWEAEQSIKEAMRTEALESLLATHPFEIPLSLVKREFSIRMDQLKNDKEFSTIWGSASEQQKNSMINSLVTQSQKAIKLASICKKLYEEKKVSVSPEELPAPSKGISKERASWEQELAFNQLLLDKTADYVIASAKQVEATKTA